MSYFALIITFHIHLCGDNKKTNKLIAPYRENYVHQILIFFVRNSFESTIEDRPVRIQMDRTGPVQIKCMQTCILTCAAVMQGVENCFMEWSIHSRIFDLMNM